MLYETLFVIVVVYNVLLFNPLCICSFAKCKRQKS